MYCVFKGDILWIHLWINLCCLDFYIHICNVISILLEYKDSGMNDTTSSSPLISLVVRRRRRRRRGFYHMIVFKPTQ